MGVVDKPLGGKAYGHIPHLPGSRMGSGDHHCSPGQARIATEKARDKHDFVVVQEKLDGSCVAAAKLNGQIVALTRAGYAATKSPYEQHHLWAAWVREHVKRFEDTLLEGERIAGEWLAQAHSTRYDLTHRDPFVPFDILVGTKRMIFHNFMHRVFSKFDSPPILHIGGPFSVSDALKAIEKSGYGALDPVEGAVWRVERKDKGCVDYLCKYVRPEKLDGTLLPEESGKDPIWNWRP